MGEPMAMLPPMPMATLATPIPMELIPTAMEDTDTLARGLLMLSLRLMLLSSMELMDMLGMLPLMPMDTLAMLDTPMPMVPTPMPMVLGTLARGLLMPNLRLMPLFSMELMDMLGMLPPTPMDTLDTPTPMVPIPMPMVLTPTLDKHRLLSQANFTQKSYS